GRGQGTGAAYKPWLTVHDLPSRGRIHRVPGITVGRVHHLLSDGEYNIFMPCDWNQRIVDIREQHPLDRFETYKIARSLGIKPPETSSGTPYVLTTDFLLVVETDTERSLFARSFKYSSYLSEKRTLEKQEIERRYWKERGVDWRIVTESDFDITLIRNISLVHPFHSLSGINEPYLGCHRDIALNILANVDRNPSQTLLNFCKQIANNMGVPLKTTKLVAKHLIARRILLTDMSSPYDIGFRRMGAYKLDMEAANGYL
ncbi:MAG: TnsA endonuclease N-terminal domain-containing protein, partial [Sedimenticola sp.]